MKTMKGNKEFDTVAMMRSIRNKHHKEYTENPELREQRLSDIREKYNTIIRTNKPARSKN